MHKAVSNIANDIYNILLPRGCFGCTATLGKGERSLCTICRNQIPFTEYNFIDENAFDQIFYGKVDIIKASSFLYYHENGLVKNIIHHLKYKNQQQIGVFLGNWYGPILKADLGLEKIDFVIAVPLHKKKQKERGYNQLNLYGKTLAHHLNATYLEKALNKTQNTKTQTHKNRLWRWHNVQELYVLTASEKITNKRILLIDDVITTGSTLEACAKCLLQAKGVQLYISTMAIVP